ncbi:MAG: inner membrane CreD family protein [Candidatus Eisenbacteria bacterium]
MSRFPAILLIWVGCAFGWMVLGSSLVARTGSAEGALGREVHLLWGPPMEQGPPVAGFTTSRTVIDRARRTDENGHENWVQEQRAVTDTTTLPLDGTALDVSLDLTHRRKGLLWFATYGVDFDGHYTFDNPGPESRDVVVRFPLGEATNLYDGFEVLDETGTPLATNVGRGGATFHTRFEPGATRTFHIRYRSRGTSTWGYRLTEGTGEVRNFSLALATDAGNVDFAPGSLSPGTQRRDGHGWRGEWRFKRLVANSAISLVLPDRLNPGPLASRITFFAPVGLLFFFFVVAIVSTAQGQRIHPMNYFFFGAAFFAFHLLFAYLVDHVAVLPSFVISAAVSVTLVASYARLFTGWRFALRRIAPAQTIYLVLFSATFFWPGYTGLAITVGAILTLFVMMQATGRLDWDAATREPSARPA